MSEASAHGRFQPFHNEHLEYVLAAKQRCAFLWIGITKFDITPTDLNPLGRDRERPENNPLTYFERITIIREALLDAGVAAQEFGFVPFPIETPKRLPLFLPKSILCFTTICEPWNREKIDLLRELGYSVEVLWERSKKVTGSAVRSHLLSGDSEWEGMVPAATAKALKKWKIGERLGRMKMGIGRGSGFLD